jgi:hypothetical protein
MITESLRIATCGVVALTSQGLPSQQFRANASQFVSHQVAVEFGAAGFPGSLVTDVRLDSVMTVSPGVVVWRGTLVDVAHQSPYLVASVGSSPIPLRLGGLPAPSVYEFADALNKPIRHVADAERRATLLSRVLDPNGAQEVLVPRDASETARDSVASLLHRLPDAWPADTSWSGDDQIFFVRRTVFSHDVSSGYGHPWTPISYSFLLDRGGHLLAWKSYAGRLKK